MKQLKQQILFALAGGTSFLRGMGAFPVMTYNSLYWRVTGYKQASVRGAVNELIVNGLVSKFKQLTLVQLRLTRVGREYLVHMFPAVERGGLRKTASGLGVGEIGKRWDGVWRLVIFHPAKKPNGAGGNSGSLRALRKELLRRGFAPLSRGVYISPFSIPRELTKLLVQRQWLGWAKVMESRKMVIADNRDFAVGVWNLDTIYNRYLNLSTRVKRLLYEVVRAKGLTDQLKSDYVRCLFEWFAILKSDPGLPKSLLPDDWSPLEIGQMLDKVGETIVGLESNG